MKTYILARRWDPDHKITVEDDTTVTAHSHHERDGMGVQFAKPLTGYETSLIAAFDSVTECHQEGTDIMVEVKEEETAKASGVAAGHSYTGDVTWARVV